MNREIFEEVKKGIGDIIQKKDKRLSEIQCSISECHSNISINSDLMNEAEAKGDPESYQHAFTLVNMYRDRLKKSEDEQRALITAPVISKSEYERVKAFLERESALAASEEQAEIWKHLEAIEEIHDKYNKYHFELKVLADECERVNKAGYTGDFGIMSVSQTPLAWFEGIKESIYYFRPKK